MPQTLHYTPAAAPAPASETFMHSLREAESVRKKILLNYSVIGSVLFIGLIIEAVTWMSIAIVIIAAFVLVYTRWYGIPVHRFESLYIHAVTQNAIASWPDLRIDYQSHLRTSELTESGILYTLPDYFSGKHLIFGDAGGAGIRMSEIYYRHNNLHGLHSVPGILNGLIMTAQIPMQTAYPTLLITDRSKLHHHADHTGFDVVEISTADAAQYHGKIPAVSALAAHLHQFTKETGIPVACSLYQDKLCCALILDESFNYFSPRITKSVFNMTPVTRYNRDVAFLISATAVAMQAAQRG